MLRYTLLLTCAISTAWAAEDDGFVSLFNGRDLTGWVNVNCAPETWSVRDGMIHCTGRPTGAMRTERQYENFILEVDWRHLQSGGNSGVFIWGTPIAAPGVPFLRGIEVQVLDHGYDAKGKNEWYTTHGDVFPIHGATMNPFGRHNGSRSFPSEERSKPSPEWNHYRIVATNGVLRLSVNGKEVSGGSDCNYRKGYLALESEGAPVEFRNVRIKELPSSGAAAEVTAPLDAGWKTMFNAVDFRGWQTNAATVKRWKIEGETLVLQPGSADAGATLWADGDFERTEITLDCRLPKNAPVTPAPTLQLRSANGSTETLALSGVQPDRFVRFLIRIEGNVATVSAPGKEAQRYPLSANAGRVQLGLPAGSAPLTFMNLFARRW